MYRHTLPPQYSTVPSYGYSNYPTLSTPSPRDRYLAAVAEARAAKAEYLAAEAARQEEEALRRRLAEIEHQQLLQEAERQRQLRAHHMQRSLRVPAYAPEYYEVEAEVPYYGHPAQRLSSCHPQPRYISQPSRAPYQQAPQFRGGFAAPLGWAPRDTSRTYETVGLDDLVNAVAQRVPNTSAPRVKQENSQVIPLEQLVNLLSGREAPAALAPKPAPPKASTPLPAPAPQSVQSLEQLLNLFLSGAAQGQSQPRPATAPKPVPVAASSFKPITVPVQEPKKAEKSLKEQLEARLNNEYASEVRDTIEALLASLSNNHSQSTPSKATAPYQPSFQSDLKPQSVASSTGKGKAKEVEQKPATVSLPSALNTITNIQSTFHNLESEFVFPAHLDFISHSEEELSTPISAGGSYVAQLAFTSNNHPFRFYQQALGGLLNKLDAVESHGNEELRKQRKVVVAQVEKALEELESEVEARWSTWVAKQKKEKVRTESQTQPEEEVVFRPRRDSKGHVEVEEIEDEALRQEEKKRRTFNGSEPTSIITPIEPEEVVVQELPKAEVVEAKNVPNEVILTVEELPSEHAEPSVVPYDILHKDKKEEVQDAEVVANLSKVEEEGEKEEPSLSPVAPAPSSLPEASARSSVPAADEVVVEEVHVEPAQVSTYPPAVYPPSESSPASSQVLPDPSESTVTIRPLSPIDFATAKQDQSEPDSEPESESELSETDGFLEAPDSETREKKRPAYKDPSDDEWSELEA